MPGKQRRYILVTIPLSSSSGGCMYSKSTFLPPFRLKKRNRISGGMESDAESVWYGLLDSKKTAFTSLPYFLARCRTKPTNPDRKSTRLNSSHVKISYAV